MVAYDDAEAGPARRSRDGAATSVALVPIVITTRQLVRFLSINGASITTKAQGRGQGRSGITAVVAPKGVRTSTTGTSCPTQANVTKMVVVTLGTTATTLGIYPVVREDYGVNKEGQSQWSPSPVFGTT